MDASEYARLCMARLEAQRRETQADARPWLAVPSAQDVEADTLLLFTPTKVYVGWSPDEWDDDEPR